jgi:acetyl/propionyl-CoA carboxylase alpha subunit
VPFFREVLTVSAFSEGNYYTDFIETEMSRMHYQQADEQLAAACIALEAYLNEITTLESSRPSEKMSNSWFIKQNLKSN